MSIMNIKLVNVIVLSVVIATAANGATILDGGWYWVSGSDTSDSSVSESSGSLEINFPTRQTVYSGVVAYFPEVSLQNTGDSVTLSFSLTTPSVSFPGGGWGNTLYSGLYNSGGKQLTSDATTWGPSTGNLFKNYSGFVTQGPIGAVSDMSINFQERSSDSGYSGLLFGATTIDSVNYPSGTISTSSTYDFSLTLTRTSNGLSYTIAYAGVSFSGTDIDPVTYDFDTFLLGFNQQAFANDSVFILSDVSVSPIPEPAGAMAIFLSVALILTLAVRVKRKS
ncbi:hypothetical protein H5P28_00980 [Ruficoccus amylovorans]|uniref:Uncharacterized protein n=1 Tax=Ruficoccus amylovorans TaxID=1804625 RepID=A0A842H999_9BACT|nr:hypothetical protein [Ruficoccus amylovorans]MBC2592825.1 hypothetical protein [Ruficoccus amylovorans]